MVDDWGKVIKLIGVPAIVALPLSSFAIGPLMGMLAKSQELLNSEKKPKASDQQTWTSISVRDTGAPNLEEELNDLREQIKALREQVGSHP